MIHPKYMAISNQYSVTRSRNLLIMDLNDGLSSLAKMES